LHGIQARAGLLMENASPSRDGPETAALLNQCSNNVPRRGPSGLPTQPAAKDSNSGKVHLHCAALHRALKVERICTGRRRVASFFCLTLMVGRTSIRFQKTAASLCCLHPATTWRNTFPSATIGVTWSLLETPDQTLMISIAVTS